MVRKYVHACSHAHEKETESDREERRVECPQQGPLPW